MCTKVTHTNDDDGDGGKVSSLKREKKNLRERKGRRKNLRKREEKKKERIKEGKNFVPRRERDEMRKKRDEVAKSGME